MHARHCGGSATLQEPSSALPNTQGSTLATVALLARDANQAPGLRGSLPTATWRHSDGRRGRLAASAWSDGAEVAPSGLPPAAPGSSGAHAAAQTRSGVGGPDGPTAPTPAPPAASAPRCLLGVAASGLSVSAGCHVAAAGPAMSTRASSTSHQSAAGSGDLSFGGLSFGWDASDTVRTGGTARPDLTRDAMVLDV
jgi:hypothetical protein